MANRAGEIIHDAKARIQSLDVVAAIAILIAILLSAACGAPTGTPTSSSAPAIGNPPSTAAKPSRTFRVGLAGGNFSIPAARAIYEGFVYRGQ